MVLILYFAFLSGLWTALTVMIYHGFLYGIIHKKIARKIGADKFQPYLYAGQAQCKGWTNIPFSILAFISSYGIYILGINQVKTELSEYYYIVYIAGYTTILIILLYGLWWIYVGVRYGIIEQKTKTYYHLTDKQKYYIETANEKERTISPHKYFRGKKAYITGIVRTILGITYITIALLIFIDRDYFIGDAKQSMYPNFFSTLGKYYKEYKLNREKEIKLQKIKKDTAVNSYKIDELKDEFEKMKENSN